LVTFLAASPNGDESGEPNMESDHRYYSRRAVQEAMAAARAVTPNAKAWHSQLADDFMKRAQRVSELSPVD